MACTQVADRGDALQVWRIAAFLKNWIQQPYTFYTFHFRSYSLNKIQNKY
jgi:hypothetical protein